MTGKCVNQEQLSASFKHNDGNEIMVFFSLFFKMMFTANSFEHDFLDKTILSHTLLLTVFTSSTGQAKNKCLV